ncbi:MAG: DUF917 domain-containing protein [Spirochaetes bacterium]|nr:MAG: DUF917 domain-containing protein [Spirochaetota bacterium]
MRKLNRQDLHDIVLGAAVLGTGGGGSLEEGLKIIDEALDDGFKFNLACPEEIPEDGYLGTSYGLGAVSPMDTGDFDKSGETAETQAMIAMEKYFNREFYGVIATELGGLNTAAALVTAARLGKPLIDADPTGRSVPCIQHTFYYLKGIPIYPITVVNDYGDEMVLPYTSSDERAELLVRAAAMASNDFVGVVDHPAKWRVLKEALFLNTISWCLEVGQLVREAQKKSQNYAYSLVEKNNGYILFEGIVSKTDREDKNGFNYGNIYIEGLGRFSGKTMQIWYQNENIMSWIDDDYYIMSPDLINIVNNGKNLPLLNPDAEIGMNVTVFGLKAFSAWRSEKGIEVLGPKFFNFDIEYKKIEDAVL